MITICLVVRDDDYHEKILSRLEFSVNFTLSSEKINSIKDLIEFNIVDWGSKHRISKNFKYFDRSFKKKIKFFYLSPEEIKKYSNKHTNYFNEGYGYNIAAQNSNKKLILIQAYDLFFDKYSVFNLNTFVRNLPKKKNR